MERFKFFAVAGIILIFAAIWQGCAEGDSDPATNDIIITWTCTGDDGDSGTATGYYGYYSSDSELIANDPAAGVPILNFPAPLVAGSVQSHIISGVPSQETLFVRIQAFDDVGNLGPFSNIARKISGDNIPPGGISDLH